MPSGRVRWRPWPPPEMLRFRLRPDPAERFAVAARFQGLALLPLGLCLLALPPSGVLPALTIGLGVLTLLKLLEARRLEERRLVALLQLVTAGLVAAQLPALAPSLLQLAATVLGLAGLLALELGAGLDWRMLLRRSVQVLAAGLPLALVLFLLVPRLEPFAALPMNGGAAATIGLSDQLDPGSIAALVSSDAPAARVSLPAGLPPPEARYWRVLVHDRFDGRSWTRSTPSGLPRGRAVAAAGATGAEVSTASAGRSGQVSQLWVASPGTQQAVPWSGSGKPLGGDLVLQANGELLHRGPRDQRRVYAIGTSVQRPAWRTASPTAAELQLPAGVNPRLEALGGSWAVLPSPLQRLRAARDWYRSHGFSYTLQPGTLPERAPLDAFLFERRRGFCGHYASSFTALMRAAGLPARVVSGYRGGRWVEALGGQRYLELRQSDAHAWSEVWLPGSGWVSVDPSRWVGAQEGATLMRRSGSVPFVWLQQQWWALDLVWTRLWLGFDRNTQASLLQWLLGPLLPGLGFIVLLAVALTLGLGLGGLALLRRRSPVDASRRQLERLLDQLQRHGLEPRPGETLAGFATRLEQRWPDLGPQWRQLVSTYQRLRFAPPERGQPGRGELEHQCRALGRRIQRLPR